MANPILTDEDLVRIFSYKEKKTKRKNAFFSFVYNILIFFALSIIAYMVVNFTAVQTKVVYWYQNEFKTVSLDTTKNQPTISKSSPNAGSIVEETEQVPADIPVMENNTINIPSLNISAPITWQVDNTASEVSKNLENGTIQINGTSLPGEKGNIYITGHSSNYIWAKGKYNSIFALLNKLVAGDYVYINYNNQAYKYKIYTQAVVYPTDLSVMAPTTDSRLTLATCWPVGTSLKRMILLANQVYPDPTKNVEPTTTYEIKSLPGGR